MTNKLKIYQINDDYIILHWSTDLIYWLVEYAPSFIFSRYDIINEYTSVKLTIPNALEETAFKLTWL